MLFESGEAQFMEQKVPVEKGSFLNDMREHQHICYLCVQDRIRILLQRMSQMMRPALSQPISVVVMSKSRGVSWQSLDKSNIVR